MTFLTRVSTDTAQIARKRLADNYAWHQELWQAFPNRPDDSRDFLFRLDRRERFLTVWILSTEEPVQLDWGEWKTKPVNSTFLKHHRYQFVLRANPTVMRVVRLEDGSRRKNGQRTAIYDADELKNWLIQKGNLSGFTVEQAVCDPPVKEYFYKDKKRCVQSRVDYTGTLSVVDYEKFQNAWLKGIGPARAFGFGLLLLSPIE
ncbi:MAG: type I-E CRISPR-associated protein Cas6/Cse3/CasE [Planctomycetia bacterium]|nr:type I-E CRISPR-associated protein Cas6/Cse3/CasE [Planctomycetia bacterium]